MDKIPNFKEIEKKVRELWYKELKDLYRWNPYKKDKIYIIDTPPPFTSGEAHMGHSLGFTWMDFIARFKRLEGYNVYFPIGWDCHGLPTELKVEKKLKIPKEDREAFLKACKEWTLKHIESMRNTFLRIGCSFDLDREYRTMDDKYKALVQYTLIKMFEKGLIYREKHPVLWCPNCETAISVQEVGYIKRKGVMAYIKLPLKDEKYNILIATTRPEMLSACVSVFIAKEKYVVTKDNLIVSKKFAEENGLEIEKEIDYKELEKKKIIIPLINREVNIISDEGVEYNFGTGIVWVCTYGDETDLKWQKKYNLSVIQVIDEKGRIMNSIEEINGLKTEEARKKIIEILKEKGYLYKLEEIEHNVLAHTERSDCLSPIELIPQEQFFIKILDYKKELLDLQKEIKFYPEEMRQRLIDWINSLSWDWIISRNRIWGLAFPFIKVNGKIIPVDIEDLPFDPRTDKEKLEKYKKRYENVETFDEVLDVWIESSITPIVIIFYALTEKEFNVKDIPKYFEKAIEYLPTNIRQQGYEIIRTWLFDTLFRVFVLTGKLAWKEALINGMVLDEKGRKMSKSLGNYVDPNEVMDKYSPDALRYWALMASHGDDYRFTWKDIETGQSFIIKLWNIARYIYMNCKDIDLKYIPELKEEDKKFIDRLKEVIEISHKLTNEYRFQEYLKLWRKFVWEEFANEYMEKVKNRVKNKDMAAKYILLKTLRIIIQYLHPAFPYITEEIYRILFSEKEGKKSLMQTTFSEIKI